MQGDPGLSSSMEPHPGNKGQNVSEPNTDQAASVDFEQLLALIIGINKYEDDYIRNLSGAVIDGENVKEFLTDMLGVPEDNIETLYDEKATKDGILNAIKKFTDIPRNVPILIYYAGHGGRAPAPADWYTSDSSNQIELLCPHDFRWSGSDTEDGQGIFDLTLAQYLNDVADSKNNISVILDCCHSGSAARGDEVQDDERVRGIELPKDYVIPLPVFEKQVASARRGVEILKRFEKRGNFSHVLLAACKRDEKARERSFGGIFTTELLELFKRGISDLTYLEVIKTINLQSYTLWQNPQCVGANRDRLLFSTSVPSPYRALSIGINATSVQGEFKLDAGTESGIVQGAEFNIYSNKNMTDWVGKVKAGAPRQYDTLCRIADDGQFPPDLRTAFALQTHIGLGRDIHLFVPCDEAFSKLRTTLTEHMQRRDKRQTFCLLDSEHDNPPEGPRADLALLVVNIKGGSFVQFDVKNQTCVKMGLTKMPYHIPLRLNDFLMTLLHSAADFYWKFKEISPSLSPLDITLESFELEEDPEREGIFKPKNDRENLINSDGMFVLNSVARELDQVDSVPYGYRINNRSNKSLYAALFYFDFSDLSILSHYKPNSAHEGQPGRLEFSIPPRRSVTIGYGDSGTVPIEIRTRSEEKTDKGILKVEQDVDVGFLRLYAATRHNEYTDISQESPLDPQRLARPFEAVGSRVVFGTLTIPVVAQGRGV
ncbi:hypothetical protein K435DRAFT_973483 [Dendrothele bispora CBS 962.96]|uniref:Peptidase C14 caspase domain-containing protein n=1 Tax=Dendrothele bispora (strain CBS 962.96) TaxID=1314807 RepID=A0A4S8KRY5_DENBC|nr:hypothetical protein K435DRAFT_973483 [Dendrothele bispora CBS 962.96]